MNEEKIKNTSKDTYKKEIQLLINRAALRYFMAIKETHTKLDKVQYDSLKYNHI